jgi:hypothetical protein
LRVEKDSGTERWADNRLEATFTQPAEPGRHEEFLESYFPEVNAAVDLNHAGSDAALRKLLHLAVTAKSLDAFSV